mgnify:FL=1
MSSNTSNDNLLVFLKRRTSPKKKASQRIPARPFAERTRFELVIRLPVCRFSKPVDSATLPPLRMFWPNGCQTFHCYIWTTKIQIFLGNQEKNGKKLFSKKATRIPDGFWSGKRDLSPLTRARAFHVTPQSASLTAPSGAVASSSRKQQQKSHPDSGWLLERKTRLELATPTLARSCSTN